MPPSTQQQHSYDPDLYDIAFLKLNKGARNKKVRRRLVQKGMPEDDAQALIQLIKDTLLPYKKLVLANLRCLCRWRFLFGCLGRYYFWCGAGNLWGGRV